MGKAKKGDGKRVKRIVLKDPNFWRGIAYAIKCTRPLVGVLRMVDSEKVPAMGFLYGAMDKAKEDIAKNLGGDEANYRELWDIIDEKWDFQMHRDLHAATYFLNPSFHYEDDVSTHREIKQRLFACMEKMIPNEEERNIADLQLDKYHLKQGLFGRNNAQGTRKARAPAVWWSQFGDEVPELQKFVIRVLSLTCSSSACERNWSMFNQVHTKKRNRLSTFKMNQLVYVMYNKKLRNKHLKRMQQKDDELIVAEELPSDDEWLVDEEAQALLNQHMEDQDQASQNIATLSEEQEDQDAGISSTSRKRKALTKEGKDKGKGVKKPTNISEDKWEDLDDDDEFEEERVPYMDCSMSDPTSDDDDGAGGEEFGEYYKQVERVRNVGKGKGVAKGLKG